MDEDFKTTTSHTIIRAWAERWGGNPAIIVDPNKTEPEVGLRVDFPGKSDEALLSHARHNKDVTWEEFFKVFEAQSLAFDYLEEPGDTPLIDAYRFLKREAINEKEEKLVIDPEELARAARDDLPEYATHGGTLDNPHQGEIEPVTPEDVAGEEEYGGSNPDPESDDQANKPAAGLDILDPEDKKRLHDSGEQ